MIKHFLVHLALLQVASAALVKDLLLASTETLAWTPMRVVVLALLLLLDVELVENDDE